MLAAGLTKEESMRTRLTSTVSGVAAVALAAAAVAGCGSSGGGSGSTKKSMELIVGTKSDNFYVTMECGAEAEAKKLGVNLKVTGPATFSPTQQKPLIDAVEVSRPDALIVAPTDSAA
ncbi:MAG: substrate-binding domain-containing protein, partial [Solirubrobacteraceae bacterium]